MFHGLTQKTVKLLVFAYAQKKSLEMLDPWTINQMMGEDWCSGFMMRNSSLSIRTPEVTSSGVMRSFNPETVKIL